MTLTQKECMLLEDMKSQEKLCIDKYAHCSAEAHDANLKNLFDYIGSVERGHLETLDKIGEGSTPSVSGGTQRKPAVTPVYCGVECSDAAKKCDAYLCTDTLTAEKHASALYNTCIFEYSSPELRNVLNHIQKEEQQHGEEIYAYMSANQMYC